MSLTNRLSLYFLAAIGVVLAGFSLVTFLIVRGHLSAQLDHRLDAMTHALVSAIEIHPGDVEWEPLERKIKIGEDPSLEQPRWAVRNLTGTLIDCSPNLEDDSVGSARATSQWRAKSCLPPTPARCWTRTRSVRLLCRRVRRASASAVRSGRSSRR